MLFYERKGLYNSQGEKIETLLQGLNRPNVTQSMSETETPEIDLLDPNLGSTDDLVECKNTKKLVSREIIDENFIHYLKRTMLDPKMDDYFIKGTEIFY